MLYRIPGLYIWCNKHKRAFKGKCPKAGKNCRLTYHSRIWNPNSQKTNIIRSWNTDDPRVACEKHIEFKKRLEENNYYLLPETLKTKRIPTVLKECVDRYIDHIHDCDVPEHEKKKLSKKYISDELATINKFLVVLKRNGIKPNYAHVEINSSVVGLFHEYLIEQDYASNSYNNFMKTLKRMYRYFSKNGWIDDNPFERVILKPIERNPQIIYEEEISELLEAIKPENGFGTKGKEKRNYYREWLKDSILLGLYTGARPSMVFQLKWKHVHENFIKAPNEKINRLQRTTTNYEFTFITEDIAAFLAGMTRGEDEDYILVPNHGNRETLRKQASWGFAHYWKLIEGREGIAFKHLRKTKLTREIQLLGDKARFLNSHKSDVTKVDHYVGQEKIVESMRGSTMFNI